MLVANRMLSLSLAGMYGALLVIPKNLRIFSMAIGDVWGPSIVARYSRADHSGMDRIMRSSIKLTGFTLALIIGLVSGLAKPFLTLWLGPSFTSMSLALALMVFPLCTNLLDHPFLDIFISLEKIRLPALSTVILSGLNLVLAVVLSPRFGVMGIVLAGMLTLTLNYSVIVPVYAAIIMGLPWWHYLKQLGGIQLLTVLVTGVCWGSVKALPVNSFAALFLIAGGISSVYLVLVAFLGLSQEERDLLISKIKSSGRRAPQD
jgi:membrane protein EpsK